MNAFPLSKKGKDQVSLSRSIGKKIVLGEENRLVIFAGPCSIHDPKIALEYARLLKELSDKVTEKIFIVMRVFLEKPRTLFGWKGFLYDPLLDESYAIQKGLYDSRKLLLDLVEMNLPIATEFLDPLLAPYTEDLISWGMIGARTSSSQIHRQMASYLPMPVGFKNEIGGIIDHAICAALAARYPQISTGIDGAGKVSSVKTTGNPHTHVVLRGSLTSSNYDPLSIDEIVKKTRFYGLSSRLLVDCAHGNSQKDPQKQESAFYSVLEQITGGNHLIMGMMLESHLQGGTALSMTDPCLDWKTTEKLILWAYQALRSVNDKQLCP